MPEVIEETPVVVPQVVPPIKAARDVCGVCLRPVLVTGNDDEGNESWGHWDVRIDMPQNPAFHFAELFVEPEVKWGFLDTRGKSDFEVTQGPSKVHSGWSGGGTA